MSNDTCFPVEAKLCHVYIDRDVLYSMSDCLWEIESHGNHLHNFWKACGLMRRILQLIMLSHCTAAHFHQSSLNLTPSLYICCGLSRQISKGLVNPSFKKEKELEGCLSFVSCICLVCKIDFWATGFVG